jgi:hypothetical protein
MKSVVRTMTTAAAIAVALRFGAPALAQADDPSGYGDGYTSGAYGRVRSADAGATIIRADAERGGSDTASVNTPLFPGDTLRTDGTQRVEVQLAGGSTVRIDTNSEVVFQSLPNPSAKFVDNTVLALNAGVVRIDSNLGEKDEFRIDTPAASVYLLGQGEFRLATDVSGGLRVASLRGVAEVVGNDASVLVRGGTGTSVVVGAVPAPPRAYVASTSDAFDRWCDSRDDTYRVHDGSVAQSDEPINVPDEVRPYQTELSINGSWGTDPTYGTVWYPTGVPYGWRPYHNGYWSYGPGGYFWVSYEPWGWAPYHYGNWQWTGYRGWCWVPGRVFAGAWVSWSWGAAYVGWAPLDYWGRPGWVGGPYYAGYYDPGCWTFVGYGNIYARSIPRYAVPIGTVHDDLRHATVVARPPRVDPRRIARSPAVRKSALQEVAADQAAHMRPIQADRRPERSLRDVQNQMMRRPQQATPAGRGKQSLTVAPSTDPRAAAPRARRIVEDPRSNPSTTMSPETRNDVRNLYQRMSRPRETRGQDGIGPRDGAPNYRSQPSRNDSSRVQSPRTQSPRAQAPRSLAPRLEDPQVRAPQGRAPQGQAPRAQPPRGQAPREQAPRAQAPRAQAPRGQAPQARAPKAQAPRAQSPRNQGPRSQAQPKGNPKHGDKH